MRKLKQVLLILTLFLPICCIAQGDSLVFEIKEEGPVFPGCEKLLTKAERLECSNQKLSEFISERIKFPILAKKKNIEGKVIVGFDVKKDGSIADARIMHDIGGGCGIEAIRVINLMNKEKIKWTPGKQQDKSVKVRFNIPINFYYQEDESEINVYTASKQTKELAAESFLDILNEEADKLLVRRANWKKISEEKFSPKLENGKRVTNLEMIYCSSIGANMKTTYLSKSGKLNKKMRKKMRSIIIGDMIEFNFELVDEKGKSTPVKKIIYSTEE